MISSTSSSLGLEPFDVVLSAMEMYEQTTLIT